MGTAIEAEITAYEPSAVSWPAEVGQLYTLVSFQFALFYCLAATGPGGQLEPFSHRLHSLSNCSKLMIAVEKDLRVHWMIVNIVGKDLDNSGATVAEYNAPTPPKVDPSSNPMR